ncbi:lysophospholipid acyltransferase family protein [Aliiroseovarius sp. PTFE2010]|uniref:lysophospholipid acyltransferase family protein n=1 Tax=Aliiroseovarius sp. PTFE2010 TaxID=3417190 RepID=UPI003CF05AC2
MSMVWQGDEQPDLPPLNVAAWLRLVARLIVLFPTLLIMTCVMLLVRLIEYPFVGQRRPVSSHFPRLFSALFFRVIGMAHRVQGKRMPHEGAVVANHSTWLDILALNARKRIFFVSKAEVADWPGIGPLAKAAGTIFIRRDPRDAKAQVALFEQRLHAGHKLLFFPEGTSSDNQRVLPFRSTLFAAFFAPELREFMYVQPVTVIYDAPKGFDPRFYGWWGDMSFGDSFVRVLSAPRGGGVTLVYHPPCKVSDFATRKELAAKCEAAVRSAMPTEARK